MNIVSPVISQWFTDLESVHTAVCTDWILNFYEIRSKLSTTTKKLLGQFGGTFKRPIFSHIDLEGFFCCSWPMLWTLL